MTNALALAAPLDQSSLTERVERVLRENILSGSIKAGSRLSVPAIASSLGVSRTPAREALFALERDGLVEVVPRRGAVVVQGTADDLRELFDLREVLDGLAARGAAERATEEQRARVARELRAHLKALRSGDPDRYLALDLSFHDSLADIAGNRRLRRSREQIRDQSRLVARTVARPGALGTKIAADHRAISAAVVDGDGEAAEHAARQHVRRVRDYALDRLFPNS